MDSSALETRRLAALDRLQLIDTPPEERFDRLTRIARRCYQSSIALFTLLHADRQWFKSHPGVAETEVSRSVAFCEQALRDARTDDRARRPPRSRGSPIIPSLQATRASVSMPAWQCTNPAASRWVRCA